MNKVSEPICKFGFNIDDNWHLEYDQYSVNLVFSEWKKNKKGEKQLYHDTYYYGTVKQALTAYLHKSMKGSLSIEGLLNRIVEAENKIETMLENKLKHKKK